MRTHGFRTGAAVALLALLAAGCSVDHPAAPRLQPGGAERLTRYVAVGDALSAGFLDAALQIDGQDSSLPALLAESMGFETAVQRMEFTQPYVHEPGVGSTEIEAPPEIAAGTLYFDGATIAVATIQRADIVPGKLLLAATVPTPYNNLGIPGATVLDIPNATSAATSLTGDNGFFDLILRNPAFGGTTALEQAIGLRPTLVTLWLGYTEIVSGARSGEPQVGLNPLAGDNILPPLTFGGALETVITQLQDGVAATTQVEPLIVLANLPPITSLPYFIPAAVFGQIYPFGTVEEAQLVLFPALTWIQVPANQGQPLPAELTLDAAEVAVLDGAVTDYNAAIAGLADTYDLPLVDVHGEVAGWTAAQRTHFLLLVQPPTSLPPAVAAATTLFSLDGLHPNDRGYAVLANAFLAVISEAVGVGLAPVEVANVTWDPTHGLAP